MLKEMDSYPAVETGELGGPLRPGVGSGVHSELGWKPDVQLNALNLP